jgi:hypothetical protein
MLDRYRPSGRCPSTLVVLALPAAALAAGVGSVYELVMHYIPLIYLDFLATLGAVVVLCVLGAWVVSAGKCRKPAAAAGLGAVLGLVAWAASFVFAWWWTVRGIPNHVGFFEYLPRRASTGFSIGRSGGGLPITGVFIYGLWAIEGLIFIVGTMALTHAAASKPFCESCGKWAGEKKFSFTVDRPGAATVEALAKAQELSDLVPDPSKKEEPGPEGTRLEYQVKGCPTCGGVDHLNVDYKYTVVENKQPTEKSKQLQVSVLIGAEELQAIQDYAGEPKPA